MSVIKKTAPTGTKADKEKWLSKTGLSMETPLSGVTGSMALPEKATQKAKAGSKQPTGNPHLADDRLYQTPRNRRRRGM